MKTRRVLGILDVVCWMVVSGTAFGQTFNSGSTETNGAYNPTCSPTPCVVTEAVTASGIYNFTTVTVPAGVTVQFTRHAANTPVTILATGDVTINGTLSVNGVNGLAAGGGGAVKQGSLGGPGGFSGGNGEVTGGTDATSGQGPGGGLPDTLVQEGVIGQCAGGGQYGAPPTFTKLIPLFGGSGGGGARNIADGNPGGSGGGGGGAILIASSSRITVNGSITANGGNAGGRYSGPGSGGAIRLVAGEVFGTGNLQAVPGVRTCGPGSEGRVRLEAFTLNFNGTVSPAATSSISPGPVTGASNPVLVNLPTLAITSVGGIAAPAVPLGLFTAADLSLPQGSSNPVPVTVTATNTPVGSPTAITVKLLPQSGGPTTLSVTAASHTGTFSSSEASASVHFPVGEVSIVQAWATMTLTGQIASLFPLIDGEPVERVQVAAIQGQPSALSLVTKSGKEVRVNQLPFEDQLRVAMAWEEISRR